MKFHLNVSDEPEGKLLDNQSSGIRTKGLWQVSSHHSDGRNLFIVLAHALIDRSPVESNA